MDNNKKIDLNEFMDHILEQFDNIAPIINKDKKIGELMSIEKDIRGFAIGYVIGIYATLNTIKKENDI